MLSNANRYWGHRRGPCPANVVAYFCLLFVFAIGTVSARLYIVEHDEAVSLSHIRLVSTGHEFSLNQTIESVAGRSPQHAPLYFILLNVWQKIAGGGGIFGLRLLSIYFGLLTTAVTFRLAMLAGGRRIGGYAAVLLSFLAFFLHFTHSIRMYSLLPLLVALLLWSYCRVIRGGSRGHFQRCFLLYLSASMLLYTHYIGATVIAALVTYQVICVRRDRRWWAALLILAAAAVTLLPWFEVIVRGVETRHDLSGGKLPLIETLHHLATVFSNGIAILFFPVVGALAARRKALNPTASLLIIVTGIILIILLFVNELTPILVIWRMRYTMIIAVPLACVAAVSVHILQQRWKNAGYAVLIAWALLCMFHYGSAHQLKYTGLGYNHSSIDNLPLYYQELMYEEDVLPKRDEIILSIAPARLVYHTLEYYRARLARFKSLIHLAKRNEGIHIESSFSNLQSLENIENYGNGIWLFYDPTQIDLYDTPVFSSWFHREFKHCTRFVEKPNLIADYYVKPTIPCALVLEPERETAEWEGGTKLGNFHYEIAEGSLTVYVDWRAVNNRKYAYSLQVLDESRLNLMQVDRIIVGERIEVSEFDTTSLPAGAYRMQLIVYDATSRRSVAGADLRGGSPFERELTLFNFEIARANE